MKQKVFLRLVDDSHIEFETIAPAGIAPFNDSVNWIDTNGNFWCFNWRQVVFYTMTPVKEEQAT